MAGTQTQTLGYSFEDEEQLTAWGRLCPTNSKMPYGVIELCEDSIAFGRDMDRCDIELYEPQISGIHTKISRNLNYGQDLKSSSHIGTVYDYSTNGTYINKRKIGKNKSSLLFDGDEITFISFAKKDKKTKKERLKVSFIFYHNREEIDGVEHDPNSVKSKYDLRTTLGTGSFATVKLGIDRNTGDRFAVKEIDKKKYEIKSKSRKTNSIMNEANILRQISHKNIIQVYDVFDEDNTLYIVLEMAMGGELFDRITAHKVLPENVARYIMQQLLEAVMYLHGNQIAHRDLKPENILMKEKDSWEIKITDFGLSRLLECDQEMLTTMCGTPLFLAPEVLSSKKRGGYGFEVDYWSIGVILYLMLVGHPPYNEKEGALLELVKNGRFSFPTQTWSQVTPQAMDLVKKLMCVDVEKRYNGEQVLAHPWMRMGNGGPSKNGSISNSNNSNNSDNSNNKQSGKKRKDMNDGSETKEEEEDDKEPAMKRYKNANGDAINTNQMSMDSFASNNLTPFDSLVGIMEPKKNDNNNNNTNTNTNTNNNTNNNNRGIANLRLNNNNNNDNFGSPSNTNSHSNGNDVNGNGASFVLKNSISMKEMSLD